MAKKEKTKKTAWVLKTDYGLDGSDSEVFDSEEKVIKAAQEKMAEYAKSLTFDPGGEEFETMGETYVISSLDDLLQVINKDPGEAAELIQEIAHDRYEDFDVSWERQEIK